MIKMPKSAGQSPPPRLKSRKIVNGNKITKSGKIFGDPTPGLDTEYKRRKTNK